MATHEAYITGVTPEYAHTLFVQNGPPNPVYRHNADCVVSAVILWPGVVASFARSVLSPTKSSPISNCLNSAYIMWKSHIHDDQFGPKAGAYNNKGEEASIDTPNYQTKPERNDGTLAPAAHPVQPTSNEPYPGT